MASWTECPVALIFCHGAWLPITRCCDDNLIIGEWLEPFAPICKGIQPAWAAKLTVSPIIQEVMSLGEGSNCAGLRSLRTTQ